ncbi:MAG: hypothetical protein WBG76_12735 [Ornithinimicrobium sp.]
MAQMKVKAYSLGFGLVQKQPFVHYWLDGDDTRHSLDVSATELMMLADMLGNEISISYDSDEQRFETTRELVGHGSHQPHPKYP